MKLTDVAKTSIITLRSHVIESQKDEPLIADPMAEYALHQLAAYAAKDGGEQVLDRQLSAALTNHLAIRARKYDAIANDFIARHPGCTVVNLGCGFDTRYWRLDHRQCIYIELDLPEVIEIKKEILGDKIDYELIGRSVLDLSWIEQVTQKTARTILFIAEGLLMYLPRDGVIRLFKTVAESVHDSQIVLEVVTEKYTRGFWKKIIILKMKKELGLDSGSSYQFGVKKARELEAFAGGIKVVDEWSYVEDPDMRPRLFKYLGFSRTQWTVMATINENR
ncbi:class I SAM-dependent methyltransferase [candidate division KSB1 bacterium]|nr:class I SAM-dependent methyltransferase [candidate division KSB1 bacterium]RQW11505.1 MAG: class I SAM-dependent methyltransferase [candidate division KSB1 bacterium]